MKPKDKSKLYDPTDFYVDHPFMKSVCQAVVNDVEGIKKSMSEQPRHVGEAFFKLVVKFAEVKYLGDEREWHAQHNATMAGFCRYAHHMLSVHCEQRDLLKIKNLVPKWSDKHNRWGWNVIYEK
ncbi:MAG: hypothetical protein C0490_09810 [Marivirga sp.]|nr:hypothetical protein [Marivirga sp.]